MKLAHAIGGRDNNFNLIRFVAAVMVMYSHSFAMAIGKAAPEPLGTLTGGTLIFGRVAVDIFFIISGFLVTASLVERQSLLGYLWARTLRILPGLIVAVLFCAYGVGLFFTSLSTEEYLGSPELKSFVLVNIKLQDTYYFLPGVFEHNPYPKAVNGSLWTLPFEVRMYLILAVIWLVARRFFSTSMLIIAAITVSTYIYLAPLAVKATMVNNYLRLGSFFALGSLFYAFRAKIPLNKWIFLLSIFLLSLVFIKPDFYGFYVIALPYAVFFLAYVPKGVVRYFNKVGDYSYGIYIYACPMQQSVAALIKGVQPYSLMALSFLFTLLLAMLSWHCVERPVLRLKPAYKPVSRAMYYAFEAALNLLGGNRLGSRPSSIRRGNKVPEES